MNLAFLVFGNFGPEYSLKRTLNDFRVKNDGNKLKRKYLMQLSRLETPKYKTMKQDPKEIQEPPVIHELNMAEGIEDEQSMQELDWEATTDQRFE